MKAIVAYLLARMNEPSSYAGLAALLAAAHVALPGAIVADVTLGGMLLSAVLAVILAEPKGTPVAQVMADVVASAAPTLKQVVEMLASTNSGSMSLPINIGGVVHNVSLVKVGDNTGGTLTGTLDPNIPPLMSGAPLSSDTYAAATSIDMPAAAVTTQLTAGAPTINGVPVAVVGQPIPGPASLLAPVPSPGSGV